MTDMFTNPALRWPMIIAIVMMLSQQLSGINVAMFYSTVIFRGAGLSHSAAVYATIGMGAVNVLMTIISVYLVDHPRFGRRSLHLAGLGGMWLASILLVICLSVFVRFYLCFYWLFPTEFKHRSFRRPTRPITSGRPTWLSSSFLPSSSPSLLDQVWCQRDSFL